MVVRTLADAKSIFNAQWLGSGVPNLENMYTLGRRIFAVGMLRALFSRIPGIYGQYAFLELVANRSVSKYGLMYSRWGRKRGGLFSHGTHKDISVNDTSCPQWQSQKIIWPGV